MKQEDKIRKEILLFIEELGKVGIALFDIESSEPKQICIISTEELEIRLDMFFESRKKKSPNKTKR